MQEKKLEKYDRNWIRSSKSKIVNNFNQSTKALKQIGLPAIIRPAFTLGGLGGGENGLHESR